MPKILEKLAVPLAMAIAPGCVDAYPESEQVVSANTLSGDPQIYALTKAESEATACSKGNETWSAVTKTLSCDAMTPDHLKEIALNKSTQFLDRVKKLFATAKVTPIALSVGSPEYEGHTYSLDEPNGAHHIFEIFGGEYEALVYLYIDAQYDNTKGYTGSESYSFTLTANSLDFYHFENGEGCIKCGNPTLKVDDPSKCASEINAAIYQDGALIIDVVANAPQKSGEYELVCAAVDSVSQKFQSVCSESSSEGTAKCVIAPDNQKVQTVDQRVPLKPNSSQADIDVLFLTLRELMIEHDYDLKPFKS